MIRRAVAWCRVGAVLAFAAIGAFARAGEHYTEYVYDADGRVEQITTTVDDAPPVVAAIAPAIVRRGPPVRMTVTGSSLRAAQITTDDAGLMVSGVTASATRITFDLAAAESVPLGPTTLRFSTVLGEASADIVIRPRLPVLQAMPDPIAMTPGQQQALALRLDTADVIDHSFTLSSGNPVVATISPGAVTVAAGALTPEEPVLVHAHTLGNAALRIDTDEIRDLAVPLFVTAPYQPPPGGASFHALLLGLHLGAPPTPPVLIERGPFATRLGLVMPAPSSSGDGVVAPLVAPTLGLSVGSVVTSLAPRVVVRGAGAASITALGVALQDVTQVQVMPADDIVATVVSAGNGAVMLQVDADAGAALGMRSLRLLDADDRPIAALAGADRFLVSDPLPQLASVAPQLLVRGAGAQVLTLRGELLSGASMVRAVPPDGVTIGSQPVVSPDGRSLTIAISAAADAMPGPRVLIVTTPAGESAATAGPTNTLQVVTGIADVVSPVAAPRVGLVLAGGEQGVQTRAVPAPLLGLSVGPVFTVIAPSAQAAGSALVLQVFGQGLDAGASVALEPGEGIEIGAPNAAPDGTSLAVPLTIAADAPRLQRRVVVATAQGPLIPAVPSAALFRVTDAVPEIDSLSPMLLVRGAPVSVLTVRGRRLAGATNVAVTPSDGVAVGPPVVAPDGQSLTVTISAAMAAGPGPRVVRVTTPAGVSDATPSAANALQIVDGIGMTVPSLSAALVGLQVGNGVQNQGPMRLFPAPVLGLVVGEDAPLPSVPRLQPAASLGIVVGPVISAVSPRYLPIDSNNVLQIDGAGLDSVDTVAVLPPDGVIVGTPLQVAPDGRSLSVPISVATDAPRVARRIVAGAGGMAVPDSTGAASQVLVVGNAPLIASIEPIQVVPGQAFVLTVRGVNLFGASSVTATPGTGLAIGNNPSVNANGTQITVAVNVAPNASAGPRAIRVIAAGGTTAPEATPANTLHVVLDE